MAVRKLIKLNSGNLMPTLGLGTYIASELQLAVDTALHAGYRHIDTALSYDNEQDIGEIINERITQGNLKRGELFVTTKVPPVYLAPTDIVYSAEESLSRLKLTYVDMLLIHNPFGMRNHGDGNLKPTDVNGERDHYHHDLVTAWRTFESLVERGVTKSIGLSNFTPRQIERIWSTARVKPANVQLECHVYLQQPVLRAACEQLGIVVTGYCPLGAPGRLDRHRHAGDREALKEPAVCSLAEKHGRTPGQVLLRYLLQLGVVPLPKSSTPARIHENLDVYDFELDKADMSQLAQLNADHKFFRFLEDQNHPEYSIDEPF